MRRGGTLGLAAVGAVGALILAACGNGSSGGGGGGGSTGSSSTAAFNQGVNQVVNPSTHKGGTLTFGDSSTPDSFDPGNTYYAWVLNFDRLFVTPLTTYKSCPGTCG